MIAMRSRLLALAALCLPALSWGAAPQGFPPGVALPSMSLDAAPARESFQPSFRVDAAGRVYWINSWGRIEVDGRQTSWRPDDERPRFLVTPAGDVVYQDSYGKIRKNGASIGASFHRDHDFEVDDAGNVYWVKDWVDQEIYRNSWATGYEIDDGTPFSVSAEGEVAYLDAEDRDLHIDGERQPLNLWPGTFVRDRQGDFVYTVRANHRWRLLEYDVSSGETRFLAMIPRRVDVQADALGNVWWIDFTRTVWKNGRRTGWKAADLALDAAGNAYGSWNHRILRNGEPTGYRSEGHFAVTPSGDVLHVIDSRGTVARNGQPTGFRID